MIAHTLGEVAFQRHELRVPQEGDNVAEFGRHWLSLVRTGLLLRGLRVLLCRLLLLSILRRRVLLSILRRRVLLWALLRRRLARILRLRIRRRVVH